MILDVRELILPTHIELISILIIWVKKEIPIWVHRKICVKKDQIFVSKSIYLFGSVKKFVPKRTKFVSKKSHRLINTVDSRYKATPRPGKGGLISVYFYIKKLGWDQAMGGLITRVDCKRHNLPNLKTQQTRTNFCESHRNNFMISNFILYFCNQESQRIFCRYFLEISKRICILILTKIKNLLTSKLKFFVSKFSLRISKNEMFVPADRIQNHGCV